MSFVMVQIMPDWERLTAHIEAHAETKDKLGWVSSNWNKFWCKYVLLYQKTRGALKL